MAVGRITGPLLAKNLLRDGIDLSFENDLLYLDVKNGRIGIKTTQPEYELDVNGTGRFKHLIVDTTSTFGKLTISGTTVSAPTDETINLANNVLVSGNLHATGNITANGSVQIGNQTGSDTLSLFADIISDITPQTPNQYNIGSEQQYWANGYFNNLIANTFTGYPGKEINIGVPTPLDVNVTPNTNPTINLNGPVRIWGDNPLGTAPITSNILYVSMDGSDTNDGRAADPSRACRTITGVLRSPYYQAGTSIKVAPGRYYEDNPLVLKPNTSIIGSDLRTTFIEPINKTQDLFWVQSGCYLAQMQFTNGQSGLLPGTGYTAGTNRGAYCAAFPPNYGQTKIDVYHSPYIQNCTNQSGPWLMDGTMFVPNQTVQVPEAVGTSTWETNTTTLLVSISEGIPTAGQVVNIGPVSQDYVNARTLLLANKKFLQEQVVAYIDQNASIEYDQAKCIRDTGLIVDSIITDLLFPDNGYTQSNFAGLQYWNQNNYVGEIGNELTTTTAAISYLSTLAQEVVQNITTGTRYQSTITQVTGAAATYGKSLVVGADIDLINTILITGTGTITDSIIPNGISPVSADAQNAYDLLQANKAYLEAEVIAYIDTIFPGFAYDQSKCVRDIGYMIDSVSFDTLYGGNRQAIQSGVYYYNYNSTSTVIANEIPQTTTAYNRIKDILTSIVTNQLIVKSIGNAGTQNTSLPAATTTEANELKLMIDLITSIIEGGPSQGLTPTPIGLAKTSNSNRLRAASILSTNKSFIVSETIAYIDQQYANGVFNSIFVYNRAKCYRDVGIVVENIAYDLTFGGNQKSVESGLAYWNGVTSVIQNEITQTADAFNYLDSLMQDIITNTTSTNLLGVYQTAPQVINTNLINGVKAGSLITKLIGIMNDIIINGPTVAPPIQIGNGPDWGSVSAEVLLHTNRQFIQREVINWINETFPDFFYNENLCYRDTGLIIDAVSQDIILNANAKSIEAAKTYWIGNKNIVGKEVVQTVAALNHAKDVALQVISNNTVTTSGFIFNSSKCGRDTGLIVDALAQDLLFSGNSQSTFAGIQYWNHGTYVGNIPNEITTTTEAIAYLGELAQKIIVGDTSGPRYSTETQNTALPIATSTQVTAVNDEFTLIGNILTNGVAGVTDLIVPNSITPSIDPNDLNAYNLLQANKNYMKAEVIAWIETNKSFNYDEQKCSRDTGLIVDAIAFDLAYPTVYQSQSTFAGIQYWNQDGYTGNIAGELTTVTNAIEYVSDLVQEIVQNITGGIRYTTATQITGASATAIEANIISNEFNLITDILTIGTAGVTDIIVSNDLLASTVTNVVNAYNLIQTNKNYIIDEAIAYVEATKTSGFVYNKETCARDVGYMLDSVSFDLLHGGNRQAVQSAVYYYRFDSTSSAITNEISQTIGAYQFIKSLSEKLIQNIEIAPLQTSTVQVTTLPPAGAEVADTIDTHITRITDIIQFGPSIVGNKESISLGASLNPDNIKAAEILIANKDFIRAETIAYINKFYVFQYDQDICARDVGYIIDSVSFDILYSGNRQAIQSAVYYWGYNNSSTSLPKERVASTLAYEYLKNLTSSIIIAQPIQITYQSTVTQVSNIPYGSALEVESVGANVDRIINIINNGPQVAGAKTPINLTPSINPYIQNAANILIANRDFIIAEVLAYVDSLANNQTFLPFYDKGANATLSIIRNFDIITNIITNGPGVAPAISQGNGIFIKTGLSPDDVKTPTIVTAVTTVSTNLYQVDLSQPTIGFGDDATLYFGTTGIYPLLDSDVPDRWQQRRIDPMGSMGGALVDGGVVSDRSPITSFVFDAFTQVNQGGRGIHIINNGYAQLVSVFTIFCSQAVTVENGGICSITNSNSNFGDQCLTAKGYGKREFSGYVKNPPVLPYYPNGIYPQAGITQIYIADPQLRPHIGLVMEVEPPANYTNLQGLPGFLTGNTNLATLTTGTIEITGIDVTGMVIGQRLYIRDQFGRTYGDDGKSYLTTGTIITDINYQSITLNYPLTSGGGDPNNSNYFNIYSCGNAYYTVLSSELAADPIAPGTLLLPGSQNTDEAASLDYLNTLTQLIIANQPVVTLQTSTIQVFDLSLQGGSGAGSFITNSLAIIGSILINGPSSAPAVTKTGTLPSGASSAASLLQQNREFLQDELIAYINQTFPSLVYDQAICRRDVGFIVDALVYDLAKGGNYNAVVAGKSYYAQAGTHHLVQLEENITDPNLFPDGAITTFYQRSYMSASGYLFEYVGAGSNYGALPQVGRADPVQSKEVIQLNNGKVFFTSTDQNGDFRIGPGLVISQATGVLSGRTFTKSLFANLTPFILAIEGI